MDLMKSSECQDELIELLQKSGGNDEVIGAVDLRREGNKTIAKYGRIYGSLCIKEGVQGLANRFSWLPPRSVKTKNDGKLIVNRFATKRLLILCDDLEKEMVKNALNGWDIIAYITETDQTFWEKCKSSNLARVEDDSENIPELLFSPSTLAKIVLDRFPERSDDQTVTLLDLGCGAGRDLVWLARQSSNQWKLSGIDNLQSIVRRTRLLVDEMGVSSSNKRKNGAVEAIVCAEATSDGSLRSLEQSEGKKATNSSKVETKLDSEHIQQDLKIFAKDHLPHQTFDILFLVRFLPLPLIESLPALSHLHTWIAISHFTSIEEADEQEPDRILQSKEIQRDFPGPPPSKRFELHHISTFVSEWEKKTRTHWEIVYHHIEPCEDGRPLRSVIFHRIE